MVIFLSLSSISVPLCFSCHNSGNCHLPVIQQILLLWKLYNGHRHDKIYYDWKCLRPVCHIFGDLSSCLVKCRCVWLKSSFICKCACRGMAVSAVIPEIFPLNASEYLVNHVLSAKFGATVFPSRSCTHERLINCPSVLVLYPLSHTSAEL